MKRTYFLNKVHEQLRVHPVCGLLGARQVGKTTLARMYVETYFKNKAVFFDLEDYADRDRLKDPMLALGSVQQDHLIIIDEIQFRPDLFSVLRVLVDRTQRKQKFLILGSASRDLIKQSSESLAGRIGYVELPPFCLFEPVQSEVLYLRGGFPISYLAESDADSFTWRKGYIKTFLERDVPNLGFNVPAEQLRRFWMMLAHYHGQVAKLSEISRSLMTKDKDVRQYLDILVGTFMVRTLQPWFENIGKRQVKSPKIYIKDTGILNTLFNIQNTQDLMTNPHLGAIWEGFALEQITQYLGIAPEDAFFWATQADAELDLFVIRNGKRLGFEFKYTDVPRTTKSMHSALIDLKLDQLYIIFPSKNAYPVTETIYACGLNALIEGKLADQLPVR